MSVSFVDGDPQPFRATLTVDTRTVDGPLSEGERVLVVEGVCVELEHSTQCARRDAQLSAHANNRHAFRELPSRSKLVRLRGPDAESFSRGDDVDSRRLCRGGDSRSWLLRR